MATQRNCFNCFDCLCFISLFVLLGVCQAFNSPEIFYEEPINIDASYLASLKKEDALISIDASKDSAVDLHSPNHFSDNNQDTGVSNTWEIVSGDGIRAGKIDDPDYHVGIGYGGKPGQNGQNGMASLQFWFRTTNQMRAGYTLQVKAVKILYIYF